MQKITSFLIWLFISVLGSFAYITIATHREEPLNAAWILLAALCTYSIGYRFYSKWIAAKVLMLNDTRATPCVVHEDGRDFVKTSKWVVFGHHFAAISGPGPLVGPVLAAQFGYLPGTLWILVGVVLGGAVQDFIILFASIRRNGKSLGEMVHDEVGSFAGKVAMVAILSIMIILVAVLSLVVVKALAHSPWGTFTILATIPIAFIMGGLLRFVCPTKVTFVTLLGVALLLLSVWGGKFFHEVPQLASLMTFSAPTLAWGIILYGLAASILPVWLLLAPRDYLSSYMKIGTIGALALGIFIVLPDLKMPALTQFVDGTGPVFSGSLFPFCFITIACGAISGFHSLIASGTTPKLITKESEARVVGYGSMLLESFVAIMALIAAATLDPGVYFAMNAPASIIGATPEASVATISGWGFPVTVEQMNLLATAVGESTLFGRAGGAPTLAVGMAHIFSQVIGGQTLMSLWYHFAIMFEALFILTTVDAGTRVGRFLLQAFLGHIYKPLGNTSSYTANIFSSALLVSAWGYFLYQGVIDPLGGINSLWPLFGIANQLLAIIALCLSITILLKMKKGWAALVPVFPLIWLASVTYTSGLQKIAHPDPRIGFLAQAESIKGKLAQGIIPADKVTEMTRTVFNMQVDAVVAGILLFLVVLILILNGRQWFGIISKRISSELKEAAWVSVDPSQAQVSRASLISSVVLTLLSLVKQGPVMLPVSSTHSDIDAGERWAKHEELKASQTKCC